MSVSLEVVLEQSGEGTAQTPALSRCVASFPRTPSSLLPSDSGFGAPRSKALPGLLSHRIGSAGLGAILDCVFVCDGFQ